MLSSSSSILISGTPLSPLNAAADVTLCTGETAPGFAELLNGLAEKADKDPPLGAAAEQAVAADAMALARALPIAAGLEQPASAAEAAIGSGKDLPVGLPEPVEADGTADTPTDAAEPPIAATALLALPAVPGAPIPQPVPAEAAQPALDTEEAPRRPSARSGLVPAATPAKPKADAPKVEGSPVTAVSVTVANQDTRGANTAEHGAREPGAAARAKSAGTVDLARAEPALASQSASASAVAPADHPARSAEPLAVRAHAHVTPAPDIDAALDKLVAAREALAPAHAAVAIDHAEFGAVSIRFEQSADGRLSAELSSADPGLQRAVTAAAATDRGSTAGSDGDDSRASHLANHRGASANGDAATGERSQSGGARDLPQRRGNGAAQSRQTTTNSRPGIFA